MKHILSLFTLGIIFYTAALPVFAEKVQGIGISQSAAGADFNYSIANSNAMTFIADQLTRSFFKYNRQGNSFTITRTLKGQVGKIKDKDIIYLKRNGVAVIAEVEASIPDYKGATCYRNKYKIKSADDLRKMLPSMLKNSVLKLVKSKYSNAKQLSGVSYIKDLSIYRWRAKGKYTIRALVCMAKINK